jgi:IS4 transposase
MAEHPLLQVLLRVQTDPHQDQAGQHHDVDAHRQKDEEHQVLLQPEQRDREDTRLKENAAYEVVEECAVPKDRNILSDQLIRFTGVQAQNDCPCLLRRVAVWDAVNKREIVLLTNMLAFGATTIAAIYKDRWEIELFFKALKQNLKVKSFVGTSENALRIQIWTALIAILLLKWLHHLSKAKWSLSSELNRSAVMADAAPPKALPPWRGARLLERLNQVIPK